MACEQCARGHWTEPLAVAVAAGDLGMQQRRWRLRDKGGGGVGCGGEGAMVAGTVAVARMAEASAATAGTAAAVAGQGPRGGARVDCLLSYRMLL